MNNILKPLKWDVDPKGVYATVDTPFRNYYVVEDADVEGKYAAHYQSKSGQPALGFDSLEDAMNWAENTHYKHEMSRWVNIDV